MATLASGLGTDLGVQVQTLTGLVKRARTTVGVSEVPTGSGNYIAEVTTPGDLGEFLVIWDWNGGVMAAGLNYVEQLTVATVMPSDEAGYGVIARAAYTHMPETIAALLKSNDFGGALSLQNRAEVVKRRVFKTPPSMADEANLDLFLIDYLGRLLALDLVPAGIDYWSRVPQASTQGDTQDETVSYISMITALNALADELLASTRRDEEAAGELVNGPKLRRPGTGPAIDSVSASHDRVTNDPRCFPRYGDFPSPSPRRRRREVW